MARTGALESRGIKFQVASNNDYGVVEEFLHIPGITQITGPDGTNSEFDITSIDSTDGKEYVPGLAELGNVTLSIIWNPSHPAHRILQKMRTTESTTPRNFQLVIPAKTILGAAASSAVRGVTLSAKTASVGAKATFSGTSNINLTQLGGIGPGSIITTGGEDLVIQELDATTPATVCIVTALDGSTISAASAATYTLKRPKFQRNFSAACTQNNPDMPLEGGATGSVTLRITGALTDTISSS